jgi:hypothetical protein
VTLAAYLGATFPGRTVAVLSGGNVDPEVFARYL